MSCRPKEDLEKELAFKEKQIKALKSKLIKVPAFLVTTQISNFAEDHPKSLPKMTHRKIIFQNEKQTVESIGIRNFLDSLKSERSST